MGYKIKILYSNKNKKEICYKSPLELYTFKLLELSENVLAYDKCKFYIYYKHQNKVKRYLPSIFVAYKDGGVEIIEVKSENLLNLKQNQVKMTALMAFCIQNMIPFSIYTESCLGLTNKIIPKTNSNSVKLLSKGTWVV